MIIEELKEESVKHGTFQENQVGFDSTSFDYIIQLLSVNFYSDPIGSFIRESVSNAYDSHVDAGVKEPVLILLEKSGESENECSITIQDFGTGISPERFENIYTKFGSSTKRDSNEFIGGFGIGRFAALSAAETLGTNIVQITNIYNGTLTKVLMYRDGSLQLPIILHESTDKPNGVTITVNFKIKDRLTILGAINDQLECFENVYVKDYLSNQESSYNKIKIKHYDNFVDTNHKRYDAFLVVLGKVVYPVNLSHFQNLSINQFPTFPIKLKFKVGELDVIPNREQLLYNTKTIKAITSKFNLAVKELEDIYNNQEVVDYDNLCNYLNYLNDANNLQLEFNKIQLNNVLPNNTYLGVNYDMTLLSDYKRISNFNLHGINFFYNSKLNNSHYSINYILSKNLCKLNSNVTSELKSLLKSGYYDYLIFPNKYDSYLLKGKQRLIRLGLKFSISKSNLRVLLSGLYNYYLSLPVIEKPPRIKKEKVLDTGEIKVAVWDNSKKTLSDITFNGLKTSRKCIIYGSVKDKLFVKFASDFSNNNLHFVRNYKFLGITKESNLKLFKEFTDSKQFKNLIRFDEFIKGNNRLVRDLGTVNLTDKLYNFYRNLDFDIKGVSIFHSDLHKINTVCAFRNKFKITQFINDYCFEICKKTNNFNFEIVSIVNLEIFDKFSFLTCLRDSYNIRKEVYYFIYDYIKLKKICFPNPNFYKTIHSLNS